MADATITNATQADHAGLADSLLFLVKNLRLQVAYADDTTRKLTQAHELNNHQMRQLHDKQAIITEQASCITRANDSSDVMANTLTNAQVDLAQAHDEMARLSTVLEAAQRDHAASSREIARLQQALARKHRMRA